MKFKIFIIISIFSINISFAQSDVWSDNTANTIEKGRKEIGLFGPLKIGLRDSLEISANPIWFIVMPHIAIKKQWNSLIGLQFASKHKITYPTLFLRALSRNGTGGILPSTSIIPQLFKLNNSIILSKEINERLTLSFNAGLDLSIGFGESNLSDIEFHFAYPRVYSFNNLLVPYAGITFTGIATEKIHYNYNLNTFILTGDNSGIIVEQQLKFDYCLSQKVKIVAGIISSYGDYPYGKDFGVFPVADIVFGF